MTLDELRQKYPQYSDMSDMQLANAFYNKFYSDMPKDEFYKKLDYNPTTAEKLEYGISQVGKSIAPYTGATTAALKGAANVPIELSNLINKGIMAVPGASKLPQGIQQNVLGQIQPLQIPSDTASQIGAAVGSSVPYAVGMGVPGAIAKTGEAIGEAAPTIANVAKYMGTPAGKALFSSGLMGTIGAAASPQQPLSGGLLGAALGVGAETAVGLPKMIAETFSAKLSPTTYTRTLLDALSDSKKVPQEMKNQYNQMQAAKMIKDDFDNKKAIATSLYMPAFDQLGDTTIYAGMDDKPFIKSNYELPKSLQNVQKDFVTNPTFTNAHQLQSAMGKELSDQRMAYARNPHPDTKNLIDNLSDAKSTIDGDIKNFMNSDNVPDNLKGQYQQATDYYRENIVPYLRDSRIRNIAQGKVTNPINLKSIFSDPGKNMYGDDINKITNFLGNDFKNKIVYDAISKTETKPTPQKLLTETNKLGDKGLGQYITPSLKDQLQQLEDKVKLKKGAERVAGGAAALGATAGVGGTSILGGHPIIGGGSAILGGAAMAPYLISKYLRPSATDLISGAGAQATKQAPGLSTMLARLLAASSLGNNTNNEGQ